MGGYTEKTKEWRRANRYKVNEWYRRWRKTPKGKIYLKRIVDRCTEKKRDLIAKAKAKGCKDCKKKFPHYLMDFDHCRGAKKYKISGRSGSRLSMGLFVKKLAKCDAVCALCHRKRTWKRLQKEGKV